MDLTHEIKENRRSRNMLYGAALGLFTIGAGVTGYVAVCNTDASRQNNIYAVDKEGFIDNSALALGGVGIASAIGSLAAFCFGNAPAKRLRRLRELEYRLDGYVGSASNLGGPISFAIVPNNDGATIKFEGNSGSVEVVSRASVGFPLDTSAYNPYRKDEVLDMANSYLRKRLNPQH